MAKKTETFDLSPDVYKITQLGAEEGSVLYDELIAALGSKVRDRVTEALEDAGGLDEKQLMVKFAGLLFELMGQVPLELKRKLRAAFRRTTEVKAVVNANEVWLNMEEAKLFDQHFAGRYSAMTAWEMACLKHNFLDFLSSGDKQSSSTPSE